MTRKERLEEIRKHLQDFMAYLERTGNLEIAFEQWIKDWRPLGLFQGLQSLLDKEINVVRKEVQELLEMIDEELTAVDN